MGFYDCYTAWVTSLRKSRKLCYHIFGFYPPEPLWGQYWDWTTIALRSSLKHILTPDMELLDMGCGPYAVLSRYSKIKLRCGKVTAVDHCEELLDYARVQDSISGVNYIWSDLFSRIDGCFSVIVFNAPYIDIGNGISEAIMPDALSQKRFSGGVDGVHTIKRFLHELRGHLKAGGITLLGVNHYHIRGEVVQAAIHESGLNTVSIRFNHLTRACVYELKE